MGAGKVLSLALLAIVLAPAVKRAYASAVIDGVALETHNKVVELHFGVRGRGLKWHLSGHGQELFVDLSDASLQITPRPLDGAEKLPVTLVRADNYGAGHVRLIIEVSGKVDYAIARMPHELVVRIASAGAVPDVAAPLLVAMERAHPTLRNSAAIRYARNPHHFAAQGAQSAPRRATARAEATAAQVEMPPGVRSSPAAAIAAPVNQGVAESSASEPLQIAAITPLRRSAAHPLVVIDPGHGGRDPGTNAAGVVAEKDLALQVAERLRQSLAARGANAELTRDSDVFLSLAQRTELANHAGADLFISIHMNSSPDAATAGIETYYLDNATDRATIRLARMENGVAGGYGAPGEPNLNYILTDLRQGYKANEAASLAQMIEAETVADVAASLGIRVNPLGAKKGPFYVLVGADMPSVLVECGFLSNPAETRLLIQPRYQQALADGIAAAVIHYFNADAAVGNL
jgi:N-acetylmuramoyl-L-alanine amidase